MQKAEDDKMYVVRDVPGHGNGLVATQTIPKGTRILCEEPIIIIPSRGHVDDHQTLESVSRQVDDLPQHQREIFLSMHNIHPFENEHERYLGIIRTVALPCEDPDGHNAAGVFLEASRINHACDNNAQKDWNANIQRHTVHALRDIEKDEQITVYYLGAHAKRETRQAALKAKFDFTCSCRLCSLPQDESRRSDEKFEKILQLDQLIERGGLDAIMSAPLHTLRYVDQIVQLYNEQGTDDAGLPRAYLDAAQISIANGDLARGRIFAERAVSGWRVSKGDDSPEVMQNKPFARDPTTHPLYGLATMWQRDVDDVPLGLGKDEFENWLWRREKPQAAGAVTAAVTTLRWRTAFPAFMGLPEDRCINPAFYERNQEGTCLPRRHWCFLGEIVGSLSLSRLQIGLRDLDARRVELFCYTPYRGRELDYALVRKGHTLAVLYAKRHSFLFEALPGIRHEDPGQAKVSITDLLKGLHALSMVIDSRRLQTDIPGIACHSVCAERGIPPVLDGAGRSSNVPWVRQKGDFDASLRQMRVVLVLRQSKSALRRRPFFGKTLAYVC